jgi:hypothetical protein
MPFLAQTILPKSGEVALGEQARCLFAATFESLEVTADALGRHGP